MPKVKTDQDMMEVIHLKSKTVTAGHSAESSSKVGNAKTVLKSKACKINESRCDAMHIHDICIGKDATNGNTYKEISKAKGSKILYSKETPKLIQKPMGEKTESLMSSGKIIRKEKLPVTSSTPSKTSKTAATRLTPNRAFKTKVTNSQKIAETPMDIDTVSNIPTFSDENLGKVVYSDIRCTPDRACKNKIPHLKQAATETEKVIEIGNETSTLSYLDVDITTAPPTLNKACKSKVYDLKQSTDESEKADDLTIEFENLTFSEKNMNKLKDIPTRFTPNRACKKQASNSKEIAKILETNDEKISKIPTFTDGNLEKIIHSEIRCTPDRACKSKISNLKQANNDPVKAIKIIDDTTVSEGETETATYRSTPSRVSKNTKHNMKQTTAEPEKYVDLTNENLSYSDEKMKKLKSIPTRFTPNRACKSRVTSFEEIQSGNGVEITGQEPSSITASMERQKKKNFAKDICYPSKSRLAEGNDLQVLTSSMENLNIRKNVKLKLNKQKDKNALTVVQNESIEKDCGSSTTIVQLQNEGNSMKEIRRPFGEKSQNKKINHSSINKPSNLKKPMAKVFKENSDCISNV